MGGRKIILEVSASLVDDLTDEQLAPLLVEMCREAA